MRGDLTFKFDKNSTDLQCFIFQFEGLGALFGGSKPTKALPVAMGLPLPPDRLQHYPKLQGLLCYSTNLYSMQYTAPKASVVSPQGQEEKHQPN